MGKRGRSRVHLLPLRPEPREVVRVHEGERRVAPTHRVLARCPSPTPPSHRTRPADRRAPSRIAASRSASAIGASEGGEGGRESCAGRFERGSVAGGCFSPVGRATTNGRHDDGEALTGQQPAAHYWSDRPTFCSVIRRSAESCRIAQRRGAWPGRTPWMSVSARAASNVASSTSTSRCASGDPMSAAGMWSGSGRCAGRVPSSTSTGSGPWTSIP